MASIFTRIINGEIPCYKVAENEDFIAFLDINPLREGHTLVVPKEEVDYIFDLEDNQLERMIVFSKKVAKAIESIIPCSRIGVSVIGLEVPHTHVHLIPLDELEDMNFSRNRAIISREKYEELAQKISDSFLS
ncbi:MAG TPA: HIT family protein [Saprospiraceae bacterium]|nr:HIT family protein [Saprospiraceae bacterium]MCB9328835.1 HIT family protein [Lewinellaceae bacterium]HPK09538.1 HIT family protein [Saprospiraceae bacterium]HPQ21377.1 HIT family protein [Saprospiraceae bacterium]HRX29915.1 HIT family protein [Saprospiraceae bacterium]